jgi:N-acetylmuramoyl-L-alanine amidase
MRTWKPVVLTLTIAAAAWAPATASAAFQHVIAKGETLSSVAAADGLSVSQLASANGMSPDSQLTAGSLLAIPPQGAATGESAGAPSTADADTDVSSPAVTSSPSAVASSAGGGYVVQPGDTLSAIAARLGVGVESLAAANGLDPSGLLISGTTLHAVGGAGSSAAPATTEMVSTSPSSEGGATSSAAGGTSSGGGAQPTTEMVSPSTVGSIAANEGVPASLAEAVGYQESGFNNGMVSHTGAVGVMQIMPSTWNWIGRNLAGPPPLSPTSATDNIRAGTLLLHSLLADTGGNEAMAVAGYYQGIQSVRAHGLYADTQAYVNNVMALRQRFGGG